MIAEYQPVLVHYGMSAKEMVEACGLRMRRSDAWKQSVFSGTGEKLFTGTPPAIKRWLRQTGRVA